MLSRFFSSSVAKKLLMSISGFGLLGFLIVHLLGNANLYLPGPVPFNTYASKLHSLGDLLEIAEFGLFGVFVLHVVTALQLKWRSKRARGAGYAVEASKGGPSKSSWISRNMMVTGALILFFVILHVKQLHFGPGVEQGYVVDIDGHQSRDIHRLVVETFKDPLYVVIYAAAMLALTLHLRHGIWSAFQSAGLSRESASKPLHWIALAVALLIGGGFFFIPIWIYFGAQR